MSASGSSTLHVHSISDGQYAACQTLKAAHKLGCHHLAVSSDGTRLASAGFGGEVKLWTVRDGEIHRDALTISELCDATRD